MAQEGFGDGTGGNTSTTPQVRTTMTLGFEPAAAAPQQVNSAIAGTPCGHAGGAFAGACPGGDAGPDGDPAGVVRRSTIAI